MEEEMLIEPETPNLYAQFPVIQCDTETREGY